MSNFYISVKHNDGNEVRLKPGGEAERNILTEVRKRLEEQGVGWLKSEAKVLAAVDKAISDTLFALKSDVLP
jgi:hypothetical protein